MQRSSASFGRIAGRGAAVLLIFVAFALPRPGLADPLAVVEAYVAAWNETDAGRRGAAVARSFAEKATYRDPVMAGDGPGGIDAMLAGVQAKFPGFVLKRTSKVDHHNGALRFTWSLGPAAGPAVVEGVDFCTLAPDGRLASVVGFIDKMPG